MPGPLRFAGFHPADNPRNNQALAAISLQADHFEANREYDQLILCTKRLIELEPWRESFHRRQMWALANIGQRKGALRQYVILTGLLWRELGITPMDETRQLYESIRNNYLLGSITLEW